MTQVCPGCGSRAVAPLGVGSFAATWECKNCGCLWDFDADDLQDKAESESDFYVYLLIELRTAFNQATDYPAWLRAEERRWVHFWIVPLRLSYGKYGPTSEGVEKGRLVTDLGVLTFERTSDENTSAFVKSRSTRWKAFGHCCAPGCVRIGALPGNAYLGIFFCELIHNLRRRVKALWGSPLDTSLAR